MNYAMNVTFQVIDDTRAKAFVNEQLVGSVRIGKAKVKGVEKTRLIFRDSSNPFRNYVKTPSLYFRGPAIDLDTTTIPELLKNHIFLRDLIPIILRNFLYGNVKFLQA